MQHVDGDHRDLAGCAVGRAVLEAIFFRVLHKFGDDMIVGDEDAALLHGKAGAMEGLRRVGAEKSLDLDDGRPDAGQHVARIFRRRRGHWNVRTGGDLRLRHHRPDGDCRGNQSGTQYGQPRHVSAFRRAHRSAPSSPGPSRLGPSRLGVVSSHVATNNSRFRHQDTLRRRWIDEMQRVGRQRKVGCGAGPMSGPQATWS